MFGRLGAIISRYVGTRAVNLHQVLDVRVDWDIKFTQKDFFLYTIANIFA